MTVSYEAGSLEALYRDWNSRMAADPHVSVAAPRSMFDEWHQAAKEPEAVAYRSDIVGASRGSWALPLGADTSSVVLYAHGGGFVVGSAAGLDGGFAPGSIVAAGDSAGGKLAVAAVLKLRDDRVPLPGAVIAFSPWLDMELAAESLITHADAGRRDAPRRSGQSGGRRGAVVGG